MEVRYFFLAAIVMGVLLMFGGLIKSMRNDPLLGGRLADYNVAEKKATRMTWTGISIIALISGIMVYDQYVAHFTLFRW